MSPTVLRQGPYRFYFYAADGAEPPHVHVEGGDGEAKFWLHPISLASSWGYSDRRLRSIRRIIQAHRDEIVQARDAFFRA